MINRLQLFCFFVIIVAVKIKVVFVQQESETRMINPTKMVLFSFGQFCSLFIVTVLLILGTDERTWPWVRLLTAEGEFSENV